MKEKSIAVLPFLNMSPDPENEYFSDGITEEIINALTTIKGLNVTARTSSFSFKNRNLDVRRIGEELGVASVLEGSVRKQNNRIRVTAQLIDAEVGFHIWSKSFDREMKDIFELQDEISMLIADQIRENWGHLELQEHLMEVPAISVEAYELYLKGKHFLHTLHKNNISKGIALLKEVTAIEPEFALAYINIHYGYNMLAAAGMAPSNDSLEKGRYYLDRALELNPFLPECYHSLGWHCLNRNWDFKTAKQHLVKALEQRPAYADAHQKLFITLALEGNLKAAENHICAALKLDPLSALTHYFRGFAFYLQEQYLQAVESYRKCFELEPRFFFGYPMMSLSIIAAGNSHVLPAEAEKVSQMEEGALECLIMKTLAFCSTKDVSSARQEIHQLQKKLECEEREGIRFFLIHMMSLLEDFEGALDLIEEGTEKREPLMTLLKQDPLLKPLHRFKRFKEAMQKIFALSDDGVPKKKEAITGAFSNSELVYLKGKLDELMIEQQLFLDPSLSLRSLAGHLQIHPNRLSCLLNERFGKNFNEYINTLRLREFQRKALNPSFKHLTLLGLAFDCGFNSKTVFNTFFKRTMGISPRSWVTSKR